MKRFQQHVNVVASHTGKEWLLGLLKTMAERKDAASFNAQHKDDINYKTGECKTVKKEAWDRWIAYLFLRNCDHSKYGSLIQWMHQVREGRIPWHAHGGARLPEQPPV